MEERFVTISFHHLLSDRLIRRDALLKDKPFVLVVKQRGRIIVKAVNAVAEQHNIRAGMMLADAKALCPSVTVFQYAEGMEQVLLSKLAEWCLRFSPDVGVASPDSIVINASGCTHLWQGEEKYIDTIARQLNAIGYQVTIALADTIGAAWALSHFTSSSTIIKRGETTTAILSLPPAALRLEDKIIQRMQKLGMYQIRSFIHMPRQVLRRRFGELLLLRLDQVLGIVKEVIEPICPVQPYQERLPSFEPIRTAIGIEIAVRQLLHHLCLRLQKESKGLRRCVLKAYRIDGNVQQAEISTSRPSRDVQHLFKLFEYKIPTIEPALGIELFQLDATIVEALTSEQETLWNIAGNNDSSAIAQLVDNLCIRLGAGAVKRYLPAEHHWPERSVIITHALDEKPSTSWPDHLPRPLHLLQKAQEIIVMVPLPDYPPVHFKYKGAIHKVVKADGPERIEEEWWIEKGMFRDYYCLEDQDGRRYWIYRLGHYDNSEPKWFIHGYFA